MKKIKIFSFLILLSLIIPAVSFVNAEAQEKCVGSTDGRSKCGQGLLTLENKLENRETRMENRIERASTTEMRLENRENNIERIRERIASTTNATSSTSTIKKLDKLDDRLAKQQEQMGKVKERLLERELKITDTLGKIASKIQERITILEGKGLNMTAAKTKLAEASQKLEEATVEADNLATLINTEITDANKDTLFTQIKTSQDKIKTLARATHALLVDTIKEITKVLPRNNQATTTYTSSV